MIEQIAAWQTLDGAPLDTSRFRREHWGRLPCVGMLRQEALEAINADLHDCDIHALLASRHGTVTMMFETPEGTYEMANVSPTAAKKLFTSGQQILVENVGSSTIDRWMKLLAAVCARPPHNRQCNLFIGPGSARTGWHFDQLHGFTIQLRGCKTWRIAPNEHVVNPMQNHTTRTRGLPKAEMALYCQRALPTDITHDVESVDMHPGKILYLPRGYWHEVTANAETSISLLLSFPINAWVDIVLGSLRTALLGDAAWRGDAIFPHTDEQRCEAEAQLETIWRKLRERVDTLNPTDVLPRVHDEWPFDGCAVRRNPLCGLQYRELDDDRIELVSTVHQGAFTRTRSATLPARWKTSVLEFLAAGPARIPGPSTDRRETTASKERQELIRLLVRMEALVMDPPRVDRPA